MVAPFIPTNCKTEPTPDGRYVRVTFERDSGENFEILVPRSQFPVLAKTIQIQADQIAPKAPQRTLLMQGQSLSVDGFRLIPSSSDELALTVFARVFDDDGERGVTISLPLTAQSAQALREKLERRLSSDDPT